MNTPQNCRFGLFSALIVVSVCSLTVSGFAQGNAFPPPTIRWEIDLNAAIARAEREQKPIFLHFIGNDAPPAQQMAVEVFSQPHIVSHLNANFVMVRVNASENVTLAQQFAVTLIPTDLIIKPNRQLVHRRTGVISVEQFTDYLTFLQRLLHPEREHASLPPASATPTVSSVSGQFPTTPPPHVSPSPHISSPPQSSPSHATAAPAAMPPATSLHAPPQQQQPPPRHAMASASDPFPFAQQMPMTQQMPAAQQPHAGTAGAMPPFSGNNSLRGGEMAASPTMSPIPSTMGMGHVPHHIPNANANMNTNTVPAAPITTTAPPILAAIAEEPAPAKMTVEVPLALEGFCPVALCSEERWISGNPAYCTMYQGYIFRFATQEALVRFAQNPANYIPIAMGEDIVLMADRNKRVNGNRKFGAWFQGRVFLFSSQETLNTFAERPDYYTEIALKYETARREQSFPLVY